MSIAIMPGSFDPITNGHVEIAQKAAKMFDQVYVVIMTNSHKKYLFSAAERKNLAQAALKEQQNIHVLSRPNTLISEVVHELHAVAVIRGVRNVQDFIYEQQIAAIYQKLDPKINTVLLFTSPENSFIASSMVKEVAKFDGDVSQFLPARAAIALKEKMNQDEG